jgi:hypothetical protein
MTGRLAEGVIEHAYQTKKRSVVTLVGHYGYSSYFEGLDSVSAVCTSLLLFMPK